MDKNTLTRTRDFVRVYMKKTDLNEPVFLF
jgi:nitrogen fixation protein